MKSERWNSFSVTNATRKEAKITYVRLNTQTPCPPRGAVPVNQGRGGRFFHSARPDRLRSWMRLAQLCQPRLCHEPTATGKTETAIARLVRAAMHLHRISRCFSCAHSVSGGKAVQMVWQHPNTLSSITPLLGWLYIGRCGVIQKGFHLSTDSRQRLCPVLFPELHR